jgi:hypothetical protein
MNHKKNNDKRAVMYTLSLTLIALILFSLSVVFFRHASFSEARNIESSFAQKIYNQQTSIENVFSKAIIQNNNFVYAANQNSFTVQEDFPPDLAGLNTLITTLKGKIENESNSLEINITEFLADESIIFQPLNITFKHSPSGNVRVVGNPNVTGYNITLSFAGEITTCTPSFIYGGSLTLNLVSTSSGIGCNTIENNVQSGSVNMVVDSLAFTITLDANGEMYFLGSAVANSTIITNFDPIGENGHFEFPIKVKINETSFDFFKEYFVKLPLLS